MQGTVHQVAVSPGGVPKLAVDSARVTTSGLAGDDQADKKHHGGPEQHICLYSLEAIEALVAEGHPIFAGATGENLTISGLDWDRLARGQQMQIGEQVVLEITWPSIPCGKNSQWFRDGDSTRMSHDLWPGWSRWYAKVITPGEVKAGDTVAVKVS